MIVAFVVWFVLTIIVVCYDKAVDLNDIGGLMSIAWLIMSAIVWIIVAFIYCLNHVRIIWH